MTARASIFLLLTGCAIQLGENYSLDSVELSKSVVTPPDTQTCTMDFTSSTETPVLASCVVRSTTTYEFNGCSDSTPAGKVFACTMDFETTYTPTGNPYTEGIWTINYISVLDSTGTQKMLADRAALVADGNTVDFIVGNPGVTGVWAQTGEDKVTQDELRADGGPQTNSVWNGTTVSIFGAKNEVVSFNTVIEAANSAAENVTVTMTDPSGPGTIDYNEARSDLFNWTSTDVELFYVRYLPIKGFGITFYNPKLDEQPIPEDLRVACSCETAGGPPPCPTDDPCLPTGSEAWGTRPNADKAYPEIAVPLELENGFDIAAGTNQQIWTDIYIPDDAVAGTYTWTLTVAEEGRAPINIPVSLQVRDFVLPDSQRAVAFISQYNVARRHHGTYDATGKATEHRVTMNSYWKTAKRHKVALIGDDAANSLQAHWDDRLDGTLFTAGNGYEGPGVGDPQDIYSIATYGTWPGTWCSPACDPIVNAVQADLQRYTTEWISWLASYTSTDYFFYVRDEPPTNCPAGAGGAGGDGWDCTRPTKQFVNRWSEWAHADEPGMPTFVTANYYEGIGGAGGDGGDLPDLDWLASTPHYADPVRQQEGYEYLKSNKRIWAYNGQRPLSGSFAMEDEGVSPRGIGWVQDKLEIEKWFFWDSTFWLDEQIYPANHETSVYRDANNFGRDYNQGYPGAWFEQGGTPEEGWPDGPECRDSTIGNACGPSSEGICGVEYRCEYGTPGWSVYTEGPYGVYHTDTSCNVGNSDVNGFIGGWGQGSSCSSGNGECMAHYYCKHNHWGRTSGTSGFSPLYGNGDGILFYPGTELVQTADSYGIDGPIASLRLKHWRRGLQDQDYLEMARAIDSVATNAIRDGLIGDVWWEQGVHDMQDPTWGFHDIPWSTDPDDWETARDALADIIEGN